MGYRTSSSRGAQAAYSKTSLKAVFWPKGGGGGSRGRVVGGNPGLGGGGHQPALEVNERLWHSAVTPFFPLGNRWDRGGQGGK